MTKPILEMTKGLPACGKTTYAKELVAKDDNWKRINKDDLREMLHGGRWSGKTEGTILSTRDSLVSGYLNAGFNVIVDDTNLHPKHEIRLRELANEFGAEFRIKEFDTTFMECIERDAKRGDKSVGHKTISNMYFQFVRPKAIDINTSLPDCFIFDIDGTLAHMNGRSPYDYDKVHTDVVNPYVAGLYRLFLRFKGDGNNLIVLSGRDSDCRDVTEQWLKDQGFEYDALYMRPEGDKRKDSIVKKELYEAHIKGKYNVLGVFDDRNQVVDMWRAQGLTCFQVDYGFF